MKYEEEDIVIPELESAPGPLRRSWTGYEDAVLWKYRDKSKTALARFLGRSVAAVDSRLARLKMERGENETA